MKKSFCALLLAITTTVVCHAGELNEYEHISPEGRLKLGDARAMRYVLPDTVLNNALSSFNLGESPGINIGNSESWGAQRKSDIIIDGDVINYCVNCTGGVSRVNWR